MIASSQKVSHLVTYVSTCGVYLLVPPPTITVKRSGYGTPTVGQSVDLNCLVNTVRGITSRITVSWISCGKILSSKIISQGASNVRYTISQLSTADVDKVYECKVVINTIPPVRAFDLIILNVNSKLYVY